MTVSDKPRPITLASILSAFGIIGLTSFGGGRPAYFRHEFVAKRRWLDDEQFLEGLTISQIVPGPNIANLSVYLGQRFRGAMGSLIAVSGVVLPGALMILLLAIFYFSHDTVPHLDAVFKGVGAAAVGLSLATGLQVGRRGLHGVQDIAIAAATFGAVTAFHLSLLIILLTFGPVSVWLHRPRRSDAPVPAETAKESQR